MKTGLSLLIALVVVCCLSTAQAADPWRHTGVARLDQARPGAEAAAEAGPQKYLQIEMRYNDQTVLRDLDKFRIVDANGKEVGEYWGNDPKKSLIFESKSRWDSLNGLYLDGFGHREPLFQQAAAVPPVRPAIVTAPSPRPSPEVRGALVRPPVEVADPYAIVPQRDVVVAPHDENIYVGPREEHVYVGPGVADDRLVIDDRDTVYDRDVVVHGHDAVIGHDTVIDDGLHYVGGHHVDVYDDDYGDRVVVHHGHHGGGGGDGYGGGGGDGYGGGGGSGGGGHHTHHKGSGGSDSSDAASSDSADSAGSDDVTIDDPTAGKAIASTMGVNPDKGAGSGSGSGSGNGSGSGSGNGSGSGAGKDGKGTGQGQGSGDGQGDGKGSDSADAGKATAKADGAGKGDGQGSADGQGQGSGNGQGSGDGQGQGSGNGQGQGSGNGQGQASANGQGQDSGNGQGQGDGNGQATANGQGQGCGDGQGQNSGEGPGQGPGDGPGQYAANGPAPGSGPGTGPGPGPGDGPGGPGGGPGYGPGGPGGPGGYGPYAYNPYRYRGPYAYNPYVYNPYGYYAPYQYNPYVPNYQQPQYVQPEHKPMEKMANLPPPQKLDKIPELVLYVTAGDPSGQGIVYQVKGTDGDVMGKVKLPETATGIDMYRDHGVVLASPRNGGKVMEIDDTGKLSTIIQKDPQLPHPVKISMPGNSDTMVVADDIANQLVMSTIAGTKPKVYQKLDAVCNSQPMRVAVTNDKGVVFSSDGEPGVHKFMGDQSAKGDKPVLPASGGVAADHSSLRWAAAQGTNSIKVYEGPRYLKTLRLPPNKRFYKGGLMSFGPDGSLCVAVQDEDNPSGDVWILGYHVDKEKVTNSFKWTHEEMQDFAVGNRMIWEHNSRPEDKNAF